MLDFCFPTKVQMQENKTKQKQKKKKKKKKKQKKKTMQEQLVIYSTYHSVTWFKKNPLITRGLIYCSTIWYQIILQIFILDKQQMQRAV